MPDFLSIESKMLVLREINLVVFFKGLPWREVTDGLILKIEQLKSALDFFN